MGSGLRHALGESWVLLLCGCWWVPLEVAGSCGGHLPAQPTRSNKLADRKRGSLAMSVKVLLSMLERCCYC